MFKRITPLVLTFVLTSFFLIVSNLNSQARPLDEILKSKVIRLGVNPGLAPLAKFDDKNQIVGFDVDIGNKLAEMLGVKLEVVQTGSPDRIPFVSTGKIDIVMGAMTRNPARQLVIDYTLPVHTEVFGVLTTDKKNYKSTGDMNTADTTLAQVRGTMPADWATKNLPNAKILLFENYPDAMRAIAQGRADSIVDVIDFLGEQMNIHKNIKWKIVQKEIDTWYCGIGVAKGNYTLQQWLNVAIFEMHRTGFVDATWKKWFGIDQIYSVKSTPYF